MPLAAFGELFSLSPTVLLIAGVVAITVLGVAWFAIRFWLASTRPVDIQEIKTPNLDRLNRQALEGLGGDDEEEEDDEAPDGLKNVVPGESADED
jgi:uncharacterized membrane protein YqiK